MEQSAFILGLKSSYSRDKLVSFLFVINLFLKN